MKELLKITFIQEDVCEVKSDVTDYEDGQQLAAALLGVLVKGNTALQSAILAATAAFIEGVDDENLRNIVAKNVIHVPVTSNKHTS